MDAGVVATTLVGRATVGDQLAWADLYRGAYPQLLAYAHHCLGSLNEAREVVGETMARAVAHIDRFDRDDGFFTPWLIGICRSVVAEMQPANYRVQRAELTDDASESATPDNALIETRERSQLRNALGRLDDHDREVLTLRAVAGLSSDQVAELLDRKPGAVRMAELRALGRLRAVVEEMTRVG